MRGPPRELGVGPPPEERGREVQRQVQLLLAVQRRLEAGGGQRGRGDVAQQRPPGPGPPGACRSGACLPDLFFIDRASLYSSTHSIQFTKKRCLQFTHLLFNRFLLKSALSKKKRFFSSNFHKKKVPKYILFFNLPRF